jgi:hypothetical protein
VHGYVNIVPYVKVVQFAVQARHSKSPPLGCFLKAILCPAAEVYPKMRLETLQTDDYTSARPPIYILVSAQGMSFAGQPGNQCSVTVPCQGLVVTPLAARAALHCEPTILYCHDAAYERNGCG